MIKIFLNRSFFYLWLSQVFTQLGSNTLTFVLALRVFELTGSNTAVGALMLMFGLPTFIFGLSAGILTEKFNKLRIIFLVNCVLLSLVVFFYFTSASLFFVFLLVLIFSLSLQFLFPSIASLIPTLVQSDQLLSANSLSTMTFYITVILGYVGAGPLLRILGKHNIFLFLGFYFLISAILIRKITFKKTLRTSGMLGSFSVINLLLDQKVFTEIIGGFFQTLDLVKNNLRIRNSILLLVFSQMLLTTLLSLSPGFAATVLSIDVASASLYVVFPAALGMLLGSIFLGFFGKKWEREKLPKIGLLSIFICLLGLSLAKLLPFSALIPTSVLILVFGLSNTLLEIPSNTTLQEESEQYRGRVYGLLGTLVHGASFLPLLLIGIAADKFGVSSVIFSISILTFGVFLVSL